MTSGKWDMKGWTKGKVSFAQALGLSPEHAAQIKFPTLTANLPSAVASSQSTTPSGGGAVAPSGTKKYTQAQLQQLWIQAGGNPSSALIASAIAEAESSGIVDNTNNDSNGTQDQGLWQINTSHGLSNMFNPLANARAAVQISSNGSNWEPWTTFQTGAYQRYM